MQNQRETYVFARVPPCKPYGKPMFFQGSTLAKPMEHLCCSRGHLQNQKKTVVFPRVPLAKPYGKHIFSKGHPLQSIWETDAFPRVPPCQIKGKHTFFQGYPLAKLKENLCLSEDPSGWHFRNGTRMARGWDAVVNFVVQKRFPPFSI